MAQINKKTIFKSYLSYFWLRPENALISTFRALSLMDHRIKDDGRSIDVSCGDGVFSFICHGGELDRNDDMFQSLNIEGTRSAKNDHFDYFDEDDYKINPQIFPQVFFHTGIDWKNSMLQKAKKLNSYSALLKHDNNRDFEFEDNKFNYIYSNSIYWVDNIKNHANELVRICDVDGQILLHIKTKNMMRYRVAAYAPELGEHFANVIDAGRLKSYLGLLDLSEYTDIFDNIPNVTIEDIVPIYNGSISKIWDIGLRPIFKPLFSMTQMVPADELSGIKIEWTETLFNLFYDNVDQHQVSFQDAMEYLIILRKSK